MAVERNLHCDVNLNFRGKVCESLSFIGYPSNDRAGCMQCLHMDSLDDSTAPSFASSEYPVLHQVYLLQSLPYVQHQHRDLCCKS